MRRKTRNWVNFAAWDVQEPTSFQLQGLRPLTLQQGLRPQIPAIGSRSTRSSWDLYPLPNEYLWIRPWLRQVEKTVVTLTYTMYTCTRIAAGLSLQNMYTLWAAVNPTCKCLRTAPRLSIQNNIHVPGHVYPYVSVVYFVCYALGLSLPAFSTCLRCCIFAKCLGRDNDAMDRWG